MMTNVGDVRTSGGLGNHRHFWVGAVGAAVPQVALLLMLAVALFRVAYDERLTTGVVYTGVAWLVILPVTTLVAVVCVLRPAHRDYGIGLLLGGAVAALTVAATNVVAVL